jgi:hypothetical protein
MPKGWFGPKHQGYGIGPRTWQGWAVTVLLLGGVILDAGFFHPERFGLPAWLHPVSVAVLGAAYLAILGWTYDEKA